jgi:hypothetical protein
MHPDDKRFLLVLAGIVLVILLFVWLGLEIANGSGV